MIRGHVAVVSGDLPLSQVPPLTPDSCRKATIRFTVDNYQCFISIDRTDYCFKVVGNVQTVDKHNIANGLVRIGFIVPNLDIVISCNPEDLKAFLYTLEVVKDIILVLPPKCSDETHKRKLICICHAPKFSQYQRFHINDRHCPLSVLEEMLCAFCCYSVLECYNDYDARKILNTWKIKLYPYIADNRITMRSITLTSYTFLRKIEVTENSLVDIPEALGSLPCLNVLILSYNQLGKATNWNWLTSLFIRENLRALYLNGNGLSSLPGPIVGLRNLEILCLNGNCLTELPAALGTFKYLRYLAIRYNNLGIMPTWMYRKERFSHLCIYGNNIPCFLTENHKPQLSPKDFETIPLPSLFETVAKYIIMERLAFLEYNIPATLTEYLEGAYYCRCSTVVFPDTIGQVVQCWIKIEALAHTYDKKDIVPIAIRCCSYDCYKLIEPYITL